MKLPWFLPLLLPGAALAEPWPPQYKIKSWETAKLTAADVVGPDGIVYPDFRRCGVEGGIPDLADPAVRREWQAFKVAEYGGVPDDSKIDDDAVSAAMTAAQAHASGGGKGLVIFDNGEFTLSRSLSIDSDHIVIEGAGADLTSLRIIGSNVKNAALFDFSGKNGSGWGRPYRKLTDSATRGAKSVAVENTGGLAVGSWIRIAPSKAGSGSTMRERYSWPESNVIYSDPTGHFGRVMFARVANVEAHRITLDRPISHDIYLDEAPELRSPDLLEGCGVRNLTLITAGPEVTLDPLRFRAVANCWLQGVTVRKPRDWPVLTFGMVNFEYRNCRFEGTWAPIGSGNRAYLGFSGYAVDCLMENCEASNLRHMPIFQGAIRCVVRNSRFTGQTVASPQLHGQFPHDSMVERCEFSTPGNAYTVDGMATLRHGVEGPRFVLYNNRFTGGFGTCYLPGGVEGHIIAYNRFEIADDKQALPGVWLADRVWDGLLIGNSIRVNRYQPVLSMQDESCTGWEIRDNTICGSNGYLAMGDSVPFLNDNNQLLPFEAPLPAPECESIFDWQKRNADSPRLVMAWPDSCILRPGEAPTILRVTRIRTELAQARTITLKATPHDVLEIPTTVTIPAGLNYADVQIKLAGTTTTETYIVLTAECEGLLADQISARVTQNPPGFGHGPPNFVSPGTPAGWKTASFGMLKSPGMVRWGEDADEVEIESAGDAITPQDSHLGRSGRTQAWQTLEGDGAITARVECPAPSAQAGLIIADDASPTTEFVLITQQGEVLASGAAVKPPAAPTEYRKAQKNQPAVWLRLTRRGAIFTAWRGRVENPLIETDWEQLAEIDMYRDNQDPPDYKATAKLDPTMHFGAFVSSGDLSKSATARFTKTTVEKIPE